MKSLNSIHISYRFFPTQDLETQRQFREFLHKKIPGYTDILLEWHNRLCKIMVREIDDWWLTYGSRLMAWIPPIYQPYFFAAALKEFRIENKIPHIHLSEVPRELKTYLQEIDPSGSYSFTLNSPRSDSLKARLKTEAVVIREFIKMLSAALKNKKDEKRMEYDYVIYSHFFGMNRWKNSGDHFFGRMLHELAQTKKVLWSYYPSVKKNELEISEIRKLIASSDCEFIDWKIKNLSELNSLLKRILKYKAQVKKARKLIPKIYFDEISCESFSKNHYEQMVEKYLPLVEWKIDLYFNHILTTHSVKKVVYPFEDKGLERAICNQCFRHKVQTYGYAHAVHNDGHLYFKIHSEMLMPPRPTKVLATGPGAAQWIRYKSQNSIPVEILGSNRYRPPAAIPGNSNDFKLLILIGQAHELTMLANWAEQNPELLEGCLITIRPYPYSDHEEQEFAISRLRKYYLIDVNKKSLERQIEECDAVLFSSTSAAFEAMLLGRICIYANLHDIVPLSPLKDKGSGTEFIDNNETAHELRLSLVRTKALSTVERKEKGLMQRRFAEKVYAEPKISILDSI